MISCVVLPGSWGGRFLISLLVGRFLLSEIAVIHKDF